jgi:starvation-inducible DNA-binding protein
MMQELQKAAQIGLASHFNFYLKSHRFHWNVEGNDFYEYHKLFEEIYQEVLDHVDDFAENIRKLDAYVPASLSAFSMLTQVADENHNLTKELMVVELLQDNEKMIKVLKLVYDLAEQAGEHGFSNFLAERMDAHRKHGWFLRSSLKGQQ